MSADREPGAARGQRMDIARAGELIGAEDDAWEESYARPRQSCAPMSEKPVAGASERSAAVVATPNRPSADFSIPTRQALAIDHFPAFAARSALFGARTSREKPKPASQAVEFLVQGGRRLRYIGPDLNLRDKLVWETVTLPRFHVHQICG
jgi:hypothetical protein